MLVNTVKTIQVTGSTFGSKYENELDILCLADLILKYFSLNFNIFVYKDEQYT